MSFKIIQTDTLLASIKSNRGVEVPHHANSLDVNQTDGSFVVSYPLLNGGCLYHYPQNPNNSHYQTKIISTIEEASPLSFPLDAKFDFCNGKLWISDNGNYRLLCVNSSTYKLLSSLKTTGIIYSIIPNINDGGCFVAMFNSLSTAQILRLDSDCNTISRFLFGFTFPYATFETFKTQAFVDSMPSSYSVSFDHYRNRLWWISDVKSCMADLATKTVSTYDLTLHGKFTANTVTIDLASGNAFICSNNGLVLQINKDNTLYLGASWSDDIDDTWNPTIPTPSDGALPSAWWDATSLNLNNNDPVSVWIDSSSNFKNATSPAPTNSPKYITNAINGLPTVRFDGTDDYLTAPHIPSLSNSSEFTYFQFARSLDVSTGKRYAFFSKGSNYYNDILYFREAGNNFETLQLDNGLDSASNSEFPITNDFKIRTWRFDGTKATNQERMISRLDEEQDALSYYLDVPATTSTDTGVEYIGTYSVNPSACYLNGDICEILIFPTALSDRDICQVERYFRQKYY